MSEGSTLAVVEKGETVSTYRGLSVWHDARWSVYELGRTIEFFIEFSVEYAGTSSKDEDWQKMQW